MRFWDSSALVSLCVDEDLTSRAESLYREDAQIAVWWSSPIECVSAFARMRREETLKLAGEEEARAALAVLADAWYEVLPSKALRGQAMRLLRLHALVTGDALQLAAAIELVGTPEDGTLVTFDDRLAAAARLEGFTVLR